MEGKVFNSFPNYKCTLLTIMRAVMTPMLLQSLAYIINIRASPEKLHNYVQQ